MWSLNTVPNGRFLKSTFGSREISARRSPIVSVTAPRIGTPTRRCKAKGASPSEAGLPAQEAERRLLERGPLSPEDRAVPAEGDDPERGARDRGVQLDGEPHRVDRVAVAVDHERAGPDRRELGRREAHVVVAVLEAVALPPEVADLLVAVDVALAHEAPLLVRPSLGRDPGH